MPPSSRKMAAARLVVCGFLWALMCGCAGGGAPQKVDISQLEGLDVPEGLKQFIGTIVTELHEVKNENAVLLKGQNRTRVVEAELRGEISWLKTDRDAFQNKTRVVEADNAALRIEVTELRGALNLFSNQTKKDIWRINARLNQCEADTSRRWWSGDGFRNRPQFVGARQSTACSQCAAHTGTVIGCRSLWAATPCPLRAHWTAPSNSSRSLTTATTRR